MLAPPRQRCWGSMEMGSPAPAGNPAGRTAPAPAPPSLQLHAHGAHVCAGLLMGLLYLMDVFPVGCKVNHCPAAPQPCTARLDAELRYPLLPNLLAADRAQHKHHQRYSITSWPCREDLGYFACFDLGIQASVRTES